MRVICLTTLAGLIAVVQSSPWQQVRDKLDAHERWAKQYTFIWYVEARTVLDAQGLKAAMAPAAQRNKDLAQFSDYLTGKREYSVQRNWILTINNTSECSFWKPNILHSSIGEPVSYELYYYEYFSILVSKYKNGRKNIIILPNTIYDGVPTSMDGGMMARCHPAFLVLANPLKCTVLIRAFYNQESPLLSQLNYARPKQQGHLLQLSAKDSHFRVEWILDKRYDYRPISFLLKSNKDEHIYIKYTVNEFKNVNGYYIPIEIIYVENIGTTRAEYYFKLKSFNRSKPIKFPISKGSTVTDLRLTDYLSESTLKGAFEKQVGYIWQGYLPTKEELKRIGYQQGYLLPPAVPHRRFSLWLFAPAFLFFAAAAYLYWKQKRR